MIRKGLKKGDKFEDGGRVFIIEEVLETGNYLSREIKEEDIIEEAEEETPAEEAEEETPAEEAEEAPAEEVKTEQPAPKKTRTKKTKEA